MGSEQYRRKEDEGTKLLITLNERIAGLIKAVDEKNASFIESLSKVESRHKTDSEKLEISIKEVGGKQSSNPCDVNGLRIKNLETANKILIAAVVLLIGKIVFSFIVL
jgi:hypothetical protein